MLYAFVSSALFPIAGTDQPFLVYLPYAVLKPDMQVHCPCLLLHLLDQAVSELGMSHLFPDPVPNHAVFGLFMLLLPPIPVPQGNRLIMDGILQRFLIIMLH